MNPDLTPQNAAPQATAAEDQDAQRKPGGPDDIRIPCKKRDPSHGSASCVLDPGHCPRQ